MWFKDIGKFASDKFKSFVPLDKKNDDLGFDEILKNIDGKKEKKNEFPAKFQSAILSNPKEFVAFNKGNPADSIKKEEKKFNDGWEDEDLQIDFKEIDEDQNKKNPTNIEKTEDIFEELKEKTQNENNKNLKDPQKKMFSKLFDVKSYISTNNKAKEEKPTNIQPSIIKNNKYIFKIILNIIVFSSKEIELLQEENKQLKEKIHRMFIQQNGLEMIGILEKEENEKERKRNLEEFEKNEKILAEKNIEVQQKLKELTFLEKKIELKEKLAVNENELDSLIQKNIGLEESLQIQTLKYENIIQEHQEELRKTQIENAKTTENYKKEVENLLSNKKYLENKLSRYLESFLKFKENITKKLAALTSIKQNYNHFSDYIKKSLINQKKETQLNQEKIKAKLNELNKFYKEQMEKHLKKIDYLTTFTENLKKTQKNEFEKMKEERELLLVEKQQNSRIFLEKEEKLKKEQIKMSNEFNLKNEEMKKLEKEFLIVKNSLENKNKEILSEKKTWSEEKSSLVIESANKTKEISKLTHEINNFKQENTRNSNLIEQYKREINENLKISKEKEQEIQKFHEKTEKLSTIIKNQEKVIANKENMIIDLELEIENFKKELNEFKRSQETNLPFLETLKKQSTPHWNTEAQEIKANVEEFPEEKWGIDDEEILLNIPENNENTANPPEKNDNLSKKSAENHEFNDEIQENLKDLKGNSQENQNLLSEEHEEITNNLNQNSKENEEFQREIANNVHNFQENCLNTNDLIISPITMNSPKDFAFEGGVFKPEINQFSDSKYEKKQENFKENILPNEKIDENIDKNKKETESMESDSKEKCKKTFALQENFNEIEEKQENESPKEKAIITNNEEENEIIIENELFEEKSKKSSPNKRNHSNIEKEQENLTLKSPSKSSEKYISHQFSNRNSPQIKEKNEFSIEKHEIYSNASPSKLRPKTIESQENKNTIFFKDEEPLFLDPIHDSKDYKKEIHQENHENNEIKELLFEENKNNDEKENCNIGEIYTDDQEMKILTPNKQSEKLFLNNEDFFEKSKNIDEEIEKNEKAITEENIREIINNIINQEINEENQQNNEDDFINYKEICEENIQKDFQDSNKDFCDETPLNQLKIEENYIKTPNKSSSSSPGKISDSSAKNMKKKYEEFISSSNIKLQEKKDDFDKDLLLDLSDIKVQNNNISEFFMEKNENDGINEYENKKTEKESLDQNNENFEDNKEKVNASEENVNNIMLQTPSIPEININTQTNKEVFPIFNQNNQNFERKSPISMGNFLNTKAIIKEVEEENQWGIEDIIEVKSPLQEESKGRLSENNNNKQFEFNIAKALDFSKDMSINDNNVNLDTNAQKTEDMFDELKFGKYETSKIMSSMEKSEIKSSKGSNDNKLPFPKRISEEFAGITKINSCEVKKDNLSGSFNNLLAGVPKYQNTKSTTNFIINKEAMALNKIYKSSNLTNNQLKTNFFSSEDVKKKNNDINLEDILGNPLFDKGKTNKF